MFLVGFGPTPEIPHVWRKLEIRVMCQDQMGVDVGFLVRVEVGTRVVYPLLSSKMK